MQTITIRRLGPEDLPVFQNVAEDVFDNPVDMTLAQDYLDAPHLAFWVAQDGDLVVAMASALIYWHPDKPREVWVNEVGVSPAWRRKGIASRLVAAVLDWARDEGIKTVWLATEGDNVPARALYRKCKGQETEEIVVYEWSQT